MIDVTDRREAEEALTRSQAQLRRQMVEIEHQALHDSLTGLPNRALYHARIEEAIHAAEATGGSVVVMMLDLDRFKEVNDTLGHQVGDALLDEVGRRLRAVVRASDTVARLGGDEFGILAPGVAEPADAVRLAHKLAERIARPIELGDLALEVDASVGIAFYPEHGTDLGTLIRHADVAMYLSKERHRPAVYAPEHDQHSRARLTAVSDLRRALERDELTVHYQVQADATSRAARRVEALVRWQHPDHGLLGPDRFIPLAERSDLIRQVTLHVLEAALRQHSIWRLHGIDLPVAVNVTGRDLLDLQLPDRVATLLQRWNVAPAALELEIAENTILTNLSRAREVLERLDDLGVRLAIDDFGTGHSSLAHLARVPIDVLKIDRSFVVTMGVQQNDAVIVRSIIDLAHNLGLEVVAEGVETEDAAGALEALGCDMLQGFLIARPMPADELGRILPGLRRAA
jgi:diguanylate cyclase (GGDEF)-like protein